MDPYTSEASNQFFSDLNDYETYDKEMLDKVVGFIFEVGELDLYYPNGNEHPAIISEAKTDSVDNFKPYSSNIHDKSESYHVTLSHIFSQHCHILSGVKPTCYVFALIWTILAIVYEAMLWRKPLASRLKLQQILVMFPALKALDVGVSGLYWSYCPWNDTD